MVLCGHSLGGYLSVCYAEKYPQRIDKLVLASPVREPTRDGWGNRDLFRSFEKETDRQTEACAVGGAQEVP